MLLDPDSPNNYSLYAASARDARPDTEQLFVLLLGSRSWEEKPNNYSVWGTRLGRNPKSEQWLVSAGLVVSPTTRRTRQNPEPDLWANPSPTV